MKVKLTSFHIFLPAMIEELWINGRKTVMCKIKSET